MLQFLPPQAQERMLDAAIAMLAPGARLVIRTGLDDGSRACAHHARASIAVANVLRLDERRRRRATRDADALRARFDAAGLQAEFTPLRGNTPFNNWRVVATETVAVRLSADVHGRRARCARRAIAGFAAPPAARVR